MRENDDLFDINMRERFQEQTSKIPKYIDEEFNKTMKFIKSGENENMKKLSNRKKVSIVASVICLSTLMMQTTFAQEIVNKVIKSLSLNNITIFENQDSKLEDREVPESAKGKIFNKNGSVIEKITQDNIDDLYNENGEQILAVDTDGTLITESYQKQILEENNKKYKNQELVVNDIDKLNGYTCFDIIIPKYLPEGFEFDKATFFKDDKGEFYDKLCVLEFINKKTGDNIYMDVRYVCEETSGETSFENIENIEVNGNNAIIGDEGITWEAEGINYFMYTYNLERAESIKIAESIK